MRKVTCAEAVAEFDARVATAVADDQCLDDEEMGHVLGEATYAEETSANPKETRQALASRIEAWEADGYLKSGGVAARAKHAAERLRSADYVAG